ncbi:putative Chromosome-associated kinesin KIF4 [Blattamonas nauphoetae]|uniref:Chromosome-associated kinesin KIF4 n=1 Tax=Blattamonas nauphoetae TaxID=2049346 RepID=A0ABQ9XFI6_9EUKA|nr:putative Chromosome-associated kinesin KIF4 [Blattamonas nauphoetae]
MKQSINVFVRVRPLLSKELADHHQECTVVYNPTQIGLDKKHFTFDYVFSQSTPQQEVFKTTVLPLIDPFFSGFNSTCLAYGQTGSGKTFTMGTGTQSLSNMEIGANIGIIPRLLRSVFDRIDSNKEQVSSRVTITFVEIYNDDIFDLLSSKPIVIGRNGQIAKSDIQVRETPTGEILLSNVRTKTALNEEDALAILQQGAAQRTVSETGMNVESSRSHAIFTLNLEQEELASKGNTHDGSRRIISSKFHLVDLAGSERQKRTGNVGVKLKESSAINSGLLALGKVINALSRDSLHDKERSQFESINSSQSGRPPHGRSPSPIPTPSSQSSSHPHLHIPYRESKLTRLLKDSLGGNSVTSFIACVSPSETSFEETLSTLEYAARTKLIKNRPVQNVQLAEEKREKEREIDGLKSQIAELEKKLLEAEEKGTNQSKEKEDDSEQNQEDHNPNADILWNEEREAAFLELMEKYDMQSLQLKETEQNWVEVAETFAKMMSSTSKLKDRINVMRSAIEAVVDELKSGGLMHHLTPKTVERLNLLLNPVLSETGTPVREREFARMQLELEELNRKAKRGRLQDDGRVQKNNPAFVSPFLVRPSTAMPTTPVPRKKGLPHNDTDEEIKRLLGSPSRFLSPSPPRKVDNPSPPHVHKSQQLRGRPPTAPTWLGDDAGSGKRDDGDDSKLDLPSGNVRLRQARLIRRLEKEVFELIGQRFKLQTELNQAQLLLEEDKKIFAQKMRDLKGALSEKEKIKEEKREMEEECKTLRREKKALETLNLSAHQEKEGWGKDSLKTRVSDTERIAAEMEGNDSVVLEDNEWNTKNEEDSKTFEASVIEAGLGEIAEEKRQLKTENRKMEEENRRLEESIEMMKREREELSERSKSELDRLGLNIKMKEGLIRELVSQNKQEVERNSSNEEKLRALEEDEERAKQELERAESELAKLRQEKGESEKEGRKLKEEKEQAVKGAEAKMLRIQKEMKQLEDKSRNIRKFEKRIEGLESEVMLMRRKEKEMREKAISEEKKAREAERERKKEANEAKQKLMESERRVKDLERENKKQREALEREREKGQEVRRAGNKTSQRGTTGRLSRLDEPEDDSEPISPAALSLELTQQITRLTSEIITEEARLREMEEEGSTRELEMTRKEVSHKAELEKITSRLGEVVSRRIRMSEKLSMWDERGEKKEEERKKMEAVLADLEKLEIRLGKQKALFEERARKGVYEMDEEKKMKEEEIERVKESLSYKQKKRAELERKKAQMDRQRRGKDGQQNVVSSSNILFTPAPSHLPPHPSQSSGTQNSLNSTPVDSSLAFSELTRAEMEDVIGMTKRRAGALQKQLTNTRHELEEVKQREEEEKKKRENLERELERMKEEKRTKSRREVDFEARLIALKREMNVISSSEQEGIRKELQQKEEELVATRRKEERERERRERLEQDNEDLRREIRNLKEFIEAKGVESGIRVPLQKLRMVEATEGPSVEKDRRKNRRRKDDETDSDERGQERGRDRVESGQARKRHFKTQNQQTPPSSIIVTESQPSIPSSHFLSPLSYNSALRQNVDSLPVSRKAMFVTPQSNREKERHERKDGERNDYEEYWDETSPGQVRVIPLNGKQNFESISDMWDDDSDDSNGSSDG